MSKGKFNIWSPKGHSVLVKNKNGEVRAELVWNPNFSRNVGGTMNQVQAWIDNEVLKLCEPYVPMDTSMLIKSGILYTVPGSGQVIYNTPYARRHYYNQPLTDSLGRHYGPSTFQGAPMRGAHWFERMKNEGGKEAILRGAKKLLAGRRSP